MQLCIIAQADMREQLELNVARRQRITFSQRIRSGERRMSRFTDKIVIITGSIGGIGLATAMRFINEGAKVVVIGRGPQSVGDVQKRMKFRGHNSSMRDLDGAELW
jgi:hypothetical protein